MEAWITWLLAVSIKAALLLAASWAGALVLRRATAAARHQIWTLGVVGSLVLPVLCWALPALLPVPTPTLMRTASFEAAAIVVTPGSTSAAATWPTWLAIAWMIGALLVAIRLLRGHLAARRLLRVAVPGVAMAWSEALRAAAASLSLTKRIELFRSANIGSPMTIGILRPRVLLPAAADAWSPERLRAVLVHELGHVRRHDTLIQLAAQLGCALYWWNPLAWLAAARLRSEREHACDDLVLAAGILPSSYAADLLDVARSVSTMTHAAICMVDPSWTEARLRRVLDTNAPRRPVRARFRVTVRGLTLACAIVLGCTSAPPPTAAPAPAPASLGTLTVGAPFVREPESLGPPYLPPPTVKQGALDLSLVATEVQRRLGNLEACYERRLAVKPALAGTVVIHWVIAESGEVMDACVTQDTVNDHDVTDCVNKLVQEGGFPAPRGGSVDVSFPFVFAPIRGSRPSG